jgi:cytochrome c oxidase assembly factor CtaG
MNFDLAITSPIVGITLLVLFVIAGKIFRDNWKQQGPNWKVKCWISGVVALVCFLVLAFIPFMPAQA